MTDQEQPKEESKQEPGPSSSTNKNERDAKGTKRPKGAAGHLTEPEKEKLMEKIDAALIAGFRPITIQKQLNIGKNTFWRLVDKLATETKNERLKKSDRLVALYLNRTEKLVERLETRYAQTKDPKEWILIAAQINNIVQQTADRLQSMGYMPKRKEQLDLSGNVQVGMAYLLKVVHTELKEAKKKLAETEVIRETPTKTSQQ